MGLILKGSNGFGPGLGPRGVITIHILKQGRNGSFADAQDWGWLGTGY